MRFKPSWPLTVSLFIIAIVFARLGLWQIERGHEKQILFDRFGNAPLMTIEAALQQVDGFARVEASGRFDEIRHVLLDNKIHAGRVGVHVLTPFYLHDGTTLLVNRGWLPLAPDRRSFPGIPTDPANRSISGLLKKPSMDGQRLGDPDVLVTEKWPQMVTYFDLDSISAALQLRLEPWLLQLDSEDPTGFEGREWKAAVMGPEVHRAYALQWLSLMLATLIVWVTLGLRQGHKGTEIRDSET